MSKLSKTLLTDAVEALLRRDYYLANCIVDKVDAIHPLFLDKKKISIRVADHESAIANINLLLDDISAENASDIADAAMN